MSQKRSSLDFDINFYRFFHWESKSVICIGKKAFSAELLFFKVIILISFAIING